MDKKQTALDYYSKQIGKLTADLVTGRITGKQIVMLQIKLLEEAKEMERERIIKAYNQDLMGGLSGYRKFNDGEDYYNETYGGNK